MTLEQSDFPADKQPAIRVVMMPRDTNALGTIFGGVILSYIDLAAAIEAHVYHPGKLVALELPGDLLHRHTRVDAGERCCRGLDLGHADAGFRVHDLTLQVRQVHLVVIAQDEPAHPGGGQIEGDG